MKENSTLRYVHQDHLTGTSMMTDSSGNQINTTVKYYPYGVRRNSQPEIDNFPTDKLFTGQRLDGKGLYYYGARYYEPTIGRFISPDTIVPDPASPQSFNRYSYCLNNPLRYTDPSGHLIGTVGGINVSALDYFAAHYDSSTISFYLGEYLNAYRAYDYIRRADNYYTNILEQSSILVNVIATDRGVRTTLDYGDRVVKCPDLAETKIENSVVNIYMNTNPAVEDQSLSAYIRNMSHEIIHGRGALADMEGKIINSMFEENLGDLYSKYICTKLGYKYPSTIAWATDEASPVTKYTGTPYEQLKSWPLNETGKRDFTYIEVIYQHIRQLYPLGPYGDYVN